MPKKAYLILPIVKYNKERTVRSIRQNDLEHNDKTQIIDGVRNKYVSLRCNVIKSCYILYNSDM